MTNELKIKTINKLVSERVNFAYSIKRKKGEHINIFKATRDLEYDNAISHNFAFIDFKDIDKIYRLVEIE